MRRFLPFFIVALLAGLIGCGGSGGGGTTTTTTTTGTNGGTTTDVRPPTGTYTAALSGSDGTTAYTGTGTVTVATGGAITVSYGSTPATGTTVTNHTLSVVVTAAGVATGTLATGTGTTATSLSATGTVSDNVNGTYLLTVATMSGTVTETDRFTLTSVFPPVGTYKGNDSGTDDQSGVYSGAGAAIVAQGGGFSLAYTSDRSFGGVSATRGQSITDGVLKTDGTLTGDLKQTVGVLTLSTSVTGKWTLANNILTLKLIYQNPGYVNAQGDHPNTTETLVLTAQS